MRHVARVLRVPAARGMLYLCSCKFLIALAYCDINFFPKYKAPIIR
jgi:hypothetical protein